MKPVLATYSAMETIHFLRENIFMTVPEKMAVR